MRLKCVCAGFGNIVSALNDRTAREAVAPRRTMSRVHYPRADSWLATKQLEWQSTRDARHDAEGAFATIVSMGDNNLYDNASGTQIRRKGKHFLEQLAPKECDALIARLQRITREQAAANEPVPPLSVRAHLACLAYDIDDGNHELGYVLYLARVGQTILRLHYDWRSDVIVAGRTDCNEPRKYHLVFPQAPDLQNQLHAQLWSLIKAHVGGKLIQPDSSPAHARQLRLHGTARQHGSSQEGIHRVLGGFYSDGTPIPLATARAEAAALCSIRFAR